MASGAPGEPQFARRQRQRLSQVLLHPMHERVLCFLVAPSELATESIRLEQHHESGAIQRTEVCHARAVR